MLTSDPIGAILLLSLLGLILLVGEVWARVGNPSPEQSRKFVHLLSGGACLLFPFLIESPLIVGAMALSMSTMFALATKFQVFKSLYRVKRSSRGSEYYPVAIFLVFLLSADNLWIYFASILTLGVADAFAALVGTKYGRIHYTVQEGKKSLEGSLAFFLITLAAIIAPAPFLTDLSLANVFQVALLTATLLTAFEAISIKGADNLFVPVAATFILLKASTEPLSLLVFQNFHLLGIFAFLTAVNLSLKALLPGERKPFDAGGILTFSLFTFTAWALGSGYFALPVITGFCLAILAWLTSNWLTKAQRSIPTRAAYRALLPPFLIILIANINSDYAAFYGPYLASLAAVTAFSITTFWRPAPHTRGPFYSKQLATLIGIVAGFVITLPPLFYHPSIGFFQGPLTITAITAVLAAINLLVVERRTRQGDEHYWPASQFLFALLAAALLYGLQYLEIVSLWSHPENTELMRYSWRPWW